MIKCSVELNAVSSRLRKSDNAEVGINKTKKHALFVVKFNSTAHTEFRMDLKFDKIHKKFIDEGKLTVVFKDPVRSVLIKTKPLLAKKLLYDISKVVPGMENVCPPTMDEKSQLSRVNEKIQKTLTVTSMEHYRRVRKDFVSTLENIVIENIGLATINMQWFNCLNLTNLELSGNNFVGLNHLDWRIFCNIHKLKNLSVLKMDNCKLKELPIKFVKNLPKKLQFVDLSNNFLQWIPEDLSDLKNLTYLNVSNNPKLWKLPNDLFFNCTKLLYFRCAETSIKYHPSIIRHFKFEFFSSSAMGSSFEPIKPIKKKPPTLLSIAAALIYDNKALYSQVPELIQPIVRAACFRCDVCLKLYPKAMREGVYFSPYTTLWIAQSFEMQNTNFDSTVPLLNSSCRQCHRNNGNYIDTRSHNHQRQRYMIFR
uniref:Uncharacterized protein n=1 Tax=Panagrolaimus sp. JU765 TaxID=591449 RepID=A0AC34QAZ7_9BILA